MINFEKNILNVLEEGMEFSIFIENVGRSSRWKFIQYLDDELVVQAPEGHLLNKPKSFASKMNLYVDFLDYTIHNSGNSDGWVITKDSNKPNYMRFECNLGNFSTLNDAKEYCVRFFMIKRPEIFSHTICNKMIRKGSGTSSEWGLVKDCLVKENITIPTELKPSNDMNSMITFNSEII